MSKVSIIIPVYNTEKYIERCIKSAINQTYKDIEIIVVNDGSTDNSIEVIKRISCIYKNIKIINQENSRQGAARNNGLRNSSGEYIMFLDSDDYLLENSIERLMKIIGDDNIAIGNMLEDKLGNIKKVQYIDDILNKANNLKINNLRHLDEAAFLSSSCHKLIKRDFLFDNNIFFPEKMIWEDGPFNLNLWLASDKINYCMEPVYCRTIRCEENDKSTIQTINEQTILDDIKSYEMSLNISKDYNRNDFILILLKNFYEVNLSRLTKIQHNKKEKNINIECQVNNLVKEWIKVVYNLKPKVKFIEIVKLKYYLLKIKLKYKIGCNKRNCYE